VYSVFGSLVTLTSAMELSSFLLAISLASHGPKWRIPKPLCIKHLEMERIAAVRLHLDHLGRLRQIAAIA
jgi:hypothetical protein